MSTLEFTATLTEQAIRAIDAYYVGSLNRPVPTHLSEGLTVNLAYSDLVNNQIDIVLPGGEGEIRVPIFPAEMAHVIFGDLTEIG